MNLKNSPYALKKQKNRYVKNAHFSSQKFKQLILLFVQDLPASKISLLTQISRVTINKTLHKIRVRIACICEEGSPFQGEVELDESYFGARRTKGKKGRGALGKTIVFGILERDKKVYTKIVSDCKAKTLQAIIKGHVDAKSIIYTDGWPAYNGLVDVGYKKHFRIQHSENQFAKGKCHVNGIESFWS